MMRTFARDNRRAPEQSAAHQPALVWVVAAVLLALAVRIVPALDAVRPVVFEDEIGYLANARAIAGAGLSHLGKMGFYEPGWSVLLAPLYLVSDNPTFIYRGAVVLAVVCGWSALWPLAGLVRASGAAWRVAIIVGALATMAPGSALMSGYAYAEGLVTLLVASVCWLATVTWRSGSTTSVVALAVAAGALPSVHGRTILFPAVLVVFFVSAVVAHRVRRWRGALGLVVMAGTYLAGRALGSWLQSNIYDIGVDRLSTALTALTQTSLRALITLPSGQLWYIGASTAGLTFLGGAVLVRRAARELHARRPGPWTTVGLLTGSVLAISGVFFLSRFDNLVRLDYLVYGRYVDSVAPVLVVIGLGWCTTVSWRRRAKWILASAVLVAALGCVLVIGAGGSTALSGRPIAALSVSGIAWALDPAVQALPVALVTAGAIVVATLTAVAPRRRLVLTIWAVCASLAIVVGEVRTMSELDRPWAQMLTMQETLESLDPDYLTYVTDSASLYGQNGYQFALPGTSFEMVTSSQRPTTDLVLARQDWPGAKIWGARIIQEDVRINQALWVMPGSLQDDLDSRGWLAPDPVDSPLPADAKQAALSLEGVADHSTIHLAQSQIRTLTVTHEGAGAPWQALGSRPDNPLGVVRVVQTWTCDGTATAHLTELPRWLQPGQSTELDISLDPAWLGDAATCSVEVGLIEEGRDQVDPGADLDFVVQR